LTQTCCVQHQACALRDHRHGGSTHGPLLLFEPPGQSEFELANLQWPQLDFGFEVVVRQALELGQVVNSEVDKGRHEGLKAFF